MAGALLLLNRPFGFVALLGVIALMGMIMRNSVILIDQIEQDRAAGVDTWNAIVEAAVRRFRPIVLTAAAAVLAMIPLVAQRVLGPDGRGHHGRLDRRHRADAAVAAGHVCRVVPRERSPSSRLPARIAYISRRIDEPDGARRRKAFASAERARVAKLVDAPGLGPDAITGVPVRVRPRAPKP